jgi:probable HAF family extracellular repeat protein
MRFLRLPTWSVVLICSFLDLGFDPCAWATENVSIIDLGALEGIDGGATAINNRGEIIVTETSGYLSPRSFLWKDGTRIPIGPVWVHDINSRGQVVGWGSPTPSEPGEGFIWQDGTFVPLGAFYPLAINDSGQVAMFPLGFDGVAFGVNARGQVVGVSSETGSYGAVLWQDGQFVELEPLPGDEESEAFGINDRGQIVGRSGSHGVLWQDGTAMELGALPGDDAAWARDINARGQVVGYSARWNGTDVEVHPVLWQDGRVIGLGLLPGHVCSEALGINDRGQVVGVSRPTCNGYGLHAVLWTVAGSATN